MADITSTDCIGTALILRYPVNNSKSTFLITEPNCLYKYFLARIKNYLEGKGATHYWQHCGRFVYNYIEGREVIRSGCVVSLQNCSARFYSVK